MIVVIFDSFNSGADGAAFSLITNSGDLARSQLLQRQAGGVVVVDPLTPETIGTADSTLLADADIRYAPIANTAVTIGYLAETADGTQFPTLRLTPRLIAKMLTQSFRNAVPKGEGGSYPPVGDSRATLRHETVVEDEEWAAGGHRFTNFTKIRDEDGFPPGLLGHTGRNQGGPV